MKLYLSLALFILTSISLNGMDWYTFKQSLHGDSQNKFYIPQNKSGNSATTQKILNKDTKTK